MKKLMLRLSVWLALAALVLSGCGSGNGTGTEPAGASSQAESSGNAEAGSSAALESGTNAGEIAESVQNPSAGETAASETEPEVFTELETPWVTLKAPADYAENVAVLGSASGDGYVLELLAKADGTSLYTLKFNLDGEYLLGTLLLDGENVIVRMDAAELNPQSADYVTYAQYQEGINTILDNLVKEHEFRVNEELPYEEPGTFAIETPLVTLQYPKKWQDRVTVKVTEAGVSFAHGETALFDLRFSEGEGFLLGTYGETPICIVDYPVTEFEDMAMQEDVNVILEYLMQDTQFKVNV